jgi:hypothetical protein
MMRIVIIQIGNSDDKLSQWEWSGFISDVAQAVKRKAGEIHFFGVSHGWEPWQNACWVIEIREKFIPQLKEELSNMKKKYRQESIAWLEGATEFI